jgi:cyclopropane fatty-acyl-phospholipid synthase-like methyltransferase
MTKGFSPSCDRNQQPILDQLSVHFKDCQQVLEIGSGTGQHAVFFAKNLPHLIWNTSDMVDNHASIHAWMEEANVGNLVAPIEFHFGKNDWPALPIDAIFTANTTHIMQREDAKLMMKVVGEQLPSGGVFCQYGPMNVNGEYTSEGNRDFDKHLEISGCGGICDIAELEAWATDMVLVEKVPMPANNFLLVWKVA